jgi:hypothetical protein
MSTCGKCQAELTEEARFCPRCGSPVGERVGGSKQEAGQPRKPAPLFGRREGLLLAGLVAVAAAGIWIAYVVGNQMRYAKYVAITVEGVRKAVRTVRFGDTKEERQVVEVRGTVDNRGSRNIKELTASVALKNAKGEVIGSCERSLATSVSEESYYWQGGGNFPAHTVTHFVVDVDSLSDDWVLEKTAITITDLKLD